MGQQLAQVKITMVCLVYDFTQSLIGLVLFCCSEVD